MRDIPKATCSNWLLGVLVPLLRAEAPWLLFMKIVSEEGPVVLARIFHMHFIQVMGPESMKKVFQVAYKNFPKDVDLSFRPFLGILGNGLVTSDGDSW